MSKTKKKGSTHNPSPYMRRFQLPNLTFTDSSGYDELLSPLESESKKKLIEEKNKQLNSTFVNYFGTSKHPDKSELDKKIGNFSKTKISIYDQVVGTETQKPLPAPPPVPPPVPPHRPHPRHKLIEIEKYRMCREISELERRSREMLDLLMSNNRIAVVITVLNPDDYLDYIYALDSIECYADHYGYHLELINMTTNPAIMQNCPHEDVFFKRHCAAVLWMKENAENFDYMLFIDADIGVINPCHHIQEYIDDDPNVEITFYDRYYDYEIAAGSYFAKNSEYSRNFLKFWADYYYKLPKSFHGTDNGALHQVFMELHFADNSSKFQCYDLWAKSQNYDDLFTYQICTRFALGDGSYFCDGRVKIVRKGTWGWVRDGWLTQTLFGPSDFMFHGWKKGKLGGEWVWPFARKSFDLQICDPLNPFVNFQYNSSFIKSDQEIMRILKAKKDQVNNNYVQVLKKLGKL